MAHSIRKILKHSDTLIGIAKCLHILRSRAQLLLISPKQMVRDKVIIPMIILIQVSVITLTATVYDVISTFQLEAV